MVSSTSLTDDILIEIFAHLPLNSIYKSNCLSKAWLSNLSNPNFFIKWFQLNYKSLPWIHYHMITQEDADKAKPWRFRTGYHELHSDFMSRNEHLFNFKFIKNQKPAYLCLLGSSNGLVLCDSWSDGQERYLVCNPLTQKWVYLPSSPCPRANGEITGYFCEYSSSFTSRFRVVCIPKFDEPSKIFNVNVFCSDLGEWKSFQVSCDENVVWGWCDWEKVVIHKGVLLWIEEGNRMIVYDLNQKTQSNGHRCSLINLPDVRYDDAEYGNNCRIGESEGWVCYAKVRWTDRAVTMNVWVLDGVKWQILHFDISISIDNIVTELSSERGRAVRIQVLGFSPVDRNIVFLSWKHWVWGLNIQTRSFEELCVDIGHLYRNGRLGPFVLKPMPTVLPAPSWNALSSDLCISN
ncbi:F-box protein At5g07610-like [Papaver somniferum]|uniref:F-box protein At5g07610-like n=1 Tax=Papaver somniferum TaxID=3469 RepID=UPI000E6F6D91|nr:F-box protein At5g07610-like [Papaver somniferum]